MAYGDADAAALQELETDSDVRLFALRAATAQIDAALASSPRQYVAPVDFDAITDADRREEVRALLALHCEALAAFHLTRASAGTGNKVQKDYADAKRFIKELADGTLELHALARRSGGNFVVQIGNRNPDFPQALFDAADRVGF